MSAPSWIPTGKSVYRAAWLGFLLTAPSAPIVQRILHLPCCTGIVGQFAYIVSSVAALIGYLFGSFALASQMSPFERRDPGVGAAFSVVVIVGSVAGMFLTKSGLDFVFFWLPLSCALAGSATEEFAS